ncbi:MAG: DNA translocase FtsK 4TM domain-containing protein, partial [Candidatus Spechtbacterales bacterium]
MAKKKKRPTNSSKKTSSTKSKKKKTSKRLELDSGVVKGIWSISMVTIALISILSFFEKAGAFGEFFKDLLNNIFGWGMYIVPIMLVVVAVAFVFSWNRDTNKSTVFAAFLFFSTVLAIFAVSNYENAIPRGGYWGLILAWPLEKFLGIVGAGVVLAALLLISIIVGFHIKVDRLMAGVLERKKLRKSSLEINTNSFGKKDRKKDKKEDDSSGNEESEESDPALEVKDYNKESDDKDNEKNSKRSKEEDEKFAGNSNKESFPNYEFPTTDLLDIETGKPTSGDIVANANIIKRTFQNFGIDVEMGEVNVGPTVTQFTLKPAEGVKLSKITALGNDLALALAAHPLRIEAPIPGRSLVGVEIPNKAVAWVRLRDLLESPSFEEKEGDLILSLGRDVKGSPVYTDLSRMPHLLIAGSTGSGKTIALNGVILSLLYRNHPKNLRLIMVDPKRVEFSVYSDIPHLLAPIVVENGKAVNALKWVVNEMERRFEVLSEVGSRDIHSYNKNKKVIKEDLTLPYIVIVVDELADLMSSKGKEVEALIVRIAQMARAVGIHLVLATQRPSVEVITGLIKANITARMAFQVASQIDSRTVLDMSGAEKLLGKGDMLFLSPERSKPVRVQGAFISEEEIKKVADHLRRQKDQMREGEVEVEDFNPQVVKSPTQSIDFDNVGGSEEEDELYEEAKALIIKDQKASASYLQRKLRVGYARAASL